MTGAFKSCVKPICGCSDPEYQGIAKQSHELTEYLDGFGIAIARAHMAFFQRESDPIPGTAHRSILPETPGHTGGGVHSASAALSGEGA